MLEIPQVINNIFYIFGITFFPVFLFFIGFILTNYIKHGVFWYSVKDIKIEYLNKEIESKDKTIENLQKENEEISKLILGKLK